MSSNDSDDVEALNAEMTAVVLESNIDLRDYSTRVEEQLATLESGSINAYVTMGPNISRLHKKIYGCCHTLERMETILSNFHRDLGAISSDIQDLQTRSMTMHQRLQNRQTVRSELNQFLSEIVIPESMVRHILLTPVTDQDFVETLHELDHKIHFVSGQSLTNYPSGQDVGAILKKLKIKSVTKIREFLLEKIRTLRKPMANYQVPQNQILRYRYFYEFLLVHETPVAREIRLTYISSMEKVYFAYFKTYTSKLLKLQMDSSTEKDELVGKKVEDLTQTDISNSSNQMKRGPNASGPSTTRLGQFGLGDRADRLLTKEGLQAAILIPHVAAVKAETRYPIEEIFRSVHYALLDTTCREFIFLGDFFLHSFGAPISRNDAGTPTSIVSPKAPAAMTGETAAGRTQIAANSLFSKVFDHTLAMFEVSVMPLLASNGQYDLLGLLLCVQLTHSMINLMNERGVCALERYWENQLTLLWARIMDRIEAHITSLRNMDVSTFSQAVAAHLPTSSRGTGGINESAAINLTPRAHSLIRPHPMSRRYAELAASLHSIGISKASALTEAGGVESGQTSSSLLDTRVLLALSRMHTEFEAACYRLAKVLPRDRLSLVFLINNFDLIITVLSEKDAGSTPEVLRCREAVAMHTDAYIDQALLPYFGSMIGFITSVEQRQPGEVDPASEGHNIEGKVTHIVKGFNIDWKNSMEKINGEIMMEFANFTLGTQIFQALLSQLIKLYHRFQQVMKISPYNNMPVRNQIVSIHQIMTEIKRFKSNF